MQGTSSDHQGIKKTLAFAGVWGTPRSERFQNQESERFGGWAGALLCLTGAGGCDGNPGSGEIGCVSLRTPLQHSAKPFRAAVNATFNSDRNCTGVTPLRSFQRPWRASYQGGAKSHYRAFSRRGGCFRNAEGTTRSSATRRCGGTSRQPKNCSRGRPSSDSHAAARYRFRARASERSFAQEW